MFSVKSYCTKANSGKIKRMRSQGFDRLSGGCVFLSVSFVLLLILGNSASAVSPRLPVLNETTGDTATLTQISSQWSVLRNAAEGQRRDFESLDDFESRIKRHRESFEQFLLYTFRVVYSPDAVSFDWENSLVILESEFQRNILRRRGGSAGGAKIRLSIGVAPGKVRDISTFPQHLTMEMAFGVTASGDFMIRELVVFFRGEKIYEE